MESSPIPRVRKNHKPRENAVLSAATRQTLFCLQSQHDRASDERVHRHLTRLLILLLFVSGLWAAWQWGRPYELGNQSPWQVEAVSVRRDQDFAWVDIELSNRSLDTIPSPPLSRLVNAAQTQKELADARISADGKTCQLRYWLEWAELENAWNLSLPSETLLIKEAGAIHLENGQSRTFHQPHW